MARLIDADMVENALLEQMRFNADNNQKSRNMGLLQARNIIQNTSTAYDVDKVVEEIRRMKFASATRHVQVLNTVKKGGVKK